jgi:hypothetical protein
MTAVFGARVDGGEHEEVGAEGEDAAKERRSDASGGEEPRCDTGEED